MRPYSPLHRYGQDFRFQITREELAVLTSQIAISKPVRGGRRTFPWAFTEHGALMAAIRQLTVPIGPAHGRKIGYHQGNR